MKDSTALTLKAELVEELCKSLRIRRTCSAPRGFSISSRQR